MIYVTKNKIYLKSVFYDIKITARCFLKNQDNVGKYLNNNRVNDKVKNRIRLASKRAKLNFNLV